MPRTLTGSSHGDKGRRAEGRRSTKKSAPDDPSSGARFVNRSSRLLAVERLVPVALLGLVLHVLEVAVDALLRVVRVLLDALLVGVRLLVDVVLGLVRLVLD